MNCNRYIRQIIRVSIFMVISIYILFTYYCAEAQWHVGTIDSTGDVGACTSLALDRSGNPHISYLDSTNGYLMYAYYDGRWHTETVDDTSAVGGFGLGHYSSLALDSSGNPHISYFDYDNNMLKYAYYDGSAWHKGPVNSVGEGGWFCSLALDKRGNPHISYSAGGFQGNVSYAHFDERWHIQVVDAGRYSSLALGSNDSPHISYYDETNTNLKYAYYDGSWHVQTVDDDNGAVGKYTSLALDSNDNPHISYYDDSNTNLKYAYYDGSWHIETVDGIVEDVGVHPSLALDSRDNPHISYSDQTNSNLKYAYYDGSWHIETVDGTIAGLDVGQWTSLALGSSDNPHISYLDHTNGDLKYAVRDPVTTTTTTMTLCPSEALYGEYSDEAMLLRSLRESLKKAPEGQAIIRLYYEWGPLVVKAMDENKEFKREIKEMIDFVLPVIAKVVE